MKKNSINLTTPIINWFSKSVEEIFNILNTSIKGLPENEIILRTQKFGFNEIINEKKESIIQLFLEQFKSILIIILIIAAAVSAIIDQPVEAIAIIVIVILAGVLGFVQEYQAGKAIESLKKMAAPHALVIRDGIEKVIYARELVPGDIVILNTGDKVPADCRVIESFNLKTDEASLTGESTGIEKHEGVLEDKVTPLGDQFNMLFMGTSVLYGRGKGVVVATGMNTEFGKIASLLQETENRKTPLQVNLNELGRSIGVYALIIAGIMSIVGLLKGNDIIEMFIWGVAIAVAIIPEALPAVVTISIALGVRRMVQRKALIRKLPAVETLGATNIICSDKTGTLTQDEMTIRKIFTKDINIDVSGVGYTPAGEFTIAEDIIISDLDSELLGILKLGALCCDAALVNENGKWTINGDPTEGAILVAAAKAGNDLAELKNKHKRVFEIPFSSESKKMTTVNEIESGKYVVICKGAPEIILANCTKYESKKGIVDFDDNYKRILDNKAVDFGRSALRVLVIAYKYVKDYKTEDLEHDLIFGGMVGMIDPPRPEVKDAIKLCGTAGIKPIMITGDHEITAVAVAKELGIMREKDLSISGIKLESMSEEEFESIVDNTVVYARISPSHKLKIVNSLMKRGNIVAMTGDGVNDAPALKKADIGVAMGIKGTEVSREAADMILTDDNFASIVAAVEEGRSIFQNIKKYLVYLLGGNLGTVLALVISLFSGLPIPLQAVQILFINFLMDGLIAISLGVEPAEKGLMYKKPRKVKDGILDKSTLYLLGFAGLVIGMLTIGVFSFYINLGYDVKKAETIFFITLIFARIFNGLACRSLEVGIFRMNFFSNLPLLLSILVSIVLTILVVNVEILREAFHNDLISLNDWVVSFILGFFVLVLVEIYKLIIRVNPKKFNSGEAR
jgi:Ca2+-transporting ATPase